MRIIDHYINGMSVPGKGVFLPVEDPSVGTAVAQVPMATKEERDLAILSCQNAGAEWSQTPPQKRSRVLFRFLEKLQSKKETLAKLISEEHGKTYRDALGEVSRGVEVVEFACGIPQLLKGDYSHQIGTGVDSWSMRPPVGICLGVTPFNFPAMVPMWMVPIALACGNTFILKPSEQVPGCAHHLASLLSECGLPPGVFNVVYGGKETVDFFLQDRRIDAVSFVGSTPVAESLYRKGSQSGKRIQALGGAKNHLIVMPDADIDLTVDALMTSAFGAAGERCMAISVAVAVGALAEPLVDKLSKKISNLRIGPGLANDPENDMGPLISREHLNKVIGYITAGIEEGAELVVDGRQLPYVKNSAGHFLGGCLFDKVTPDMRIYREEIFGPVLCVVRVDDFHSAINLVNQHEFANGAVIFTRSGEVAREFSHHIAAGMVGINVPIPVPMAFHSFGGWKRSLFGPLHVHGPEGIRFFTRLKTITSRWPQSGLLDQGYAMPTM